MDYILNTIENGVSIIQLNRPDKFNSFNRQMALELISVLEAAKVNTSVRSVLLTGSGKAFCAGQDLSEAIDDNGPGIKKIVEEHYNKIILAIRHLPKPIVCAVNGVAAGAGANIALACDITVAAKTASFIQAFSKIGLVPDSGGTFFLPRIIGLQKATALMMLGDKINAEEAQQLNMIYKVVDDEALIAETSLIAVRLAEMPTKAFEFTKILLNQSFENSLEKQLEQEGIYQVKAAATADYKEGVNAFIEKRKANFTGQ
jgi:2-(1,2-epoxy-1,2-dihydrophenyl)acetyl-CoA isomerase